MSSLSFVSSSIVYYLVFKVHYQPLLFWWAQVDSNHRPHAYQACALTTWAMSPQKVVEISGIEPLTSCVQGRRSPSWAKPPSFTTVFSFESPKTLKIKQYQEQKPVMLLHLLASNMVSLERRWSSRTFRYGYLVTTSPQSPVLPSATPSFTG